MRLWHKFLLGALPDAQFKGQLRECVAIMRDWRDKGKTNHVLINRVMDYPKSEFTLYFLIYAMYYEERYGKKLTKYIKEFEDFSDSDLQPVMCFQEWHDKEYLRVCMANLYEKHFFGKGKSRITDEEWDRLLDKYKKITGEDYKI